MSKREVIDAITYDGLMAYNQDEFYWNDCKVTKEDGDYFIVETPNKLQELYIYRNKTLVMFDNGDFDNPEATRFDEKEWTKERKKKAHKLLELIVVLKDDNVTDDMHLGDLSHVDANEVCLQVYTNKGEVYTYPWSSILYTKEIY